MEPTTACSEVSSVTGELSTYGTKNQYAVYPKTNKVTVSVGRQEFILLYNRIGIR